MHSVLEKAKTWVTGKVDYVKRKWSEWRKPKVDTVNTQIDTVSVQEPSVFHKSETSVKGSTDPN